MGSDFILIIRWWFIFIAVSIIFLPLTNRIFSSFFDKGYLFSKVLGIGIIAYSVFILGILHILPFSVITIFTVSIIAFIINYFFVTKKNRLETLLSLKKTIVLEEIIFFLGIVFWSFIRGHEPSIHSLEKFMDFGFINSILRSEYFPPKDLWFTPLPINYYYFGHLITALLTKISFIPSYVTYNLMLATLFSFTFSLAFSLGINVYSSFSRKRNFITGALAAFLTALAGNIHTLYTLFLPYQNEHPIPFWTLKFSPLTFPNSYWYANATRFIPFTIHEFPIYSFVVADLHGHVLDIPFVLLTLALLLSMYKSGVVRIPFLFLLSFLLSIMYMTNVWDGIIYSLLSLFVISYLSYKNIQKTHKNLRTYIYPLTLTIIKKMGILMAMFYIFILPFNHFFIPFVSGIGIVCAPSFLTRIGKLGPFLFEPDHCQRSPWWQLLMLYGFFYLLAYWFIVTLILRTKKLFKKETPFILILLLIATILIIIPEFIYAKDIYPAHYRANTMFKLVYQAFIMLSLSSAYIIMALRDLIKKIIFFPIIFILLVLVLVFPYFAVQSYYQVPPPTIATNCNPNQPFCFLSLVGAVAKKSVDDYKGLDGLIYIKDSYPEDYAAINWINSHIKNQPVMVEGQGDSYTDYERISANTGLPTILGWTVHEWLWRGTYDIPAPRIQEVKDLYESTDINKTKNLLKKYHVEYVYVGGLERQKYPALYEQKFLQLGKVVFNTGRTTIYHF